MSSTKLDTVPSCTENSLESDLETLWSVCNSSTQSCSVTELHREHLYELTAITPMRGLFLKYYTTILSMKVKSLPPAKCVCWGEL